MAKVMRMCGKIWSIGVGLALAGLLGASAAQAASNQVSTVRTSLKLVDHTGTAGIAGQRVVLLRENGKDTGLKAETDENGIAAFEVLPGFRHAFRVHYNGGRLVTDVVDADATVTVQTEVTTLVLLDGDKGAVEGARVVLQKVKENGKAGGTGVRSVTDADGRAVFDVLPGFAHRLRVRVKRDQRVTETLTGGTEVTLDLSQDTDSPPNAAKPTLVDAAVDEPLEFGLDQNHPNPFNPSTTVGYSISKAAHVRLVVYSVLGQEIRELVNDVQAAGRHQVRWDGTDAFGRQVATGLYITRLVAGPNVAIRKMTFSK